MKSGQDSLLGVMERHVQFVIPVFQRAYAWKEEQCDMFWRDIVYAGRVGNRHFMGTFLYAPDKAGETGTKRVRVIDGQQRLTTLSLLVIALARRIERGDVVIEGITADDLKERFLHIDGVPKLVPSERDCETYEKILEGQTPESGSERLIENFAWFAEQMDAPDFDADELVAGLRALTVITAELEDRDRPQVIFESLNSKGMPLTAADLVRNYLLIAQTPAEQTRLYNTYWVPIQDLFGDDPGATKLNNAIVGWLQVRYPKARALSGKEAYTLFKRYIQDEYTGTTEDLLDELRGFCMVWAENYRYHAVKKYRSANWAKNGNKTLVSDRPLKKRDFDDSDTGLSNVDSRW